MKSKSLWTPDTTDVTGQNNFTCCLKMYKASANKVQPDSHNMTSTCDAMRARQMGHNLGLDSLLKQVLQT